MRRYGDITACFRLAYCRNLSAISLIVKPLETQQELQIPYRDWCDERLIQSQIAHSHPCRSSNRCIVSSVSSILPHCRILIARRTESHSILDLGIEWFVNNEPQNPYSFFLRQPQGFSFTSCSSSSSPFSRHLSSHCWQKNNHVMISSPRDAPLSNDSPRRGGWVASHRRLDPNHRYYKEASRTRRWGLFLCLRRSRRRRSWWGNIVFLLGSTFRVMAYCLDITEDVGNWSL